MCPGDQHCTSPTWMVPVSQFVDQNCLCFEDQEENKLEYTLVHNAFKQLVEDLLAAHLAELQISTEEFTSFCEYGLSGSNELHRSLVEQLISVDDFLVFKAMMLKRNSELSREALNPVGQIVVADDAVPAPPHTEELETEAERLVRLEAEQRCVEAELQLAIALSRHLEKRLQLIEALNEVLEMAAQLSAHAESMSAQAEAEAAQQAALAAAQMIQQQQEQFSLPPTLQIQPLLDGGIGASPITQEDPYAEERRRLDAAEQQERAQIAVAQASAAHQLIQTTAFVGLCLCILMIVAGCILLGAAGVMKYVERGTKMFEKDLRKRVGLFVMTGLAKLSEMLAKPHSEEVVAQPWIRTEA
eukprot:s1271_g2.t2